MHLSKQVGKAIRLTCLQLDYTPFRASPTHLDERNKGVVFGLHAFRCVWVTDLPLILWHKYMGCVHVYLFKYSTQHDRHPLSKYMYLCQLLFEYRVLDLLYNYTSRIHKMNIF